MNKRLGDQTPGIRKLKTEKPVSQISDAEWKSVLTPEEYEVTRQAGKNVLAQYKSLYLGTEPQGGSFDKFFEKGRYICTCCGSELFK